MERAKLEEFVASAALLAALAGQHALLGQTVRRQQLVAGGGAGVADPLHLYLPP